MQTYIIQSKSPQSAGKLKTVKVSPLEVLPYTVSAGYEEKSAYDLASILYSCQVTYSYKCMWSLVAIARHVAMIYS